MTSTKKNIFFDPPTPSVYNQFEGTPLPETDCGRPTFYHPPPPLTTPVRAFSKIFQERMLQQIHIDFACS